MSFSGRNHDTYEIVLFIFMACVAGLMLICSIAVLRKLKIFVAYLLPALCLTIVSENVVMSLANSIHPSSAAARFAYAVHALHVPLFVLTLYEISFWLHRSRYASFIFLAFDEERESPGCSGRLSVWGMRLVALILLAINLIIDFRFIPDLDYHKAGRGGYMYLAKHDQSITIWLSLIPPIVLSIVGLSIGCSSAR